MAGQNHHFSQYAPAKIPYAIERYVKETNRLYGVLADSSLLCRDCRPFDQRQAVQRLLSGELGASQLSAIGASEHQRRFPTERSSNQRFRCGKSSSFCACRSKGTIQGYMARA
jgi:hypothetical protein